MGCKLLFVGDVVLGEGCVDSPLLSKDFEDRIGDCDMFCCNFEAPTQNKELKPQKKIGPNNTNSKETISILKEAGINVVTLANNHIFDFGKEGIRHTLKLLEDSDMDYIGAGLNHESIYSPYIKVFGGTKIGIVNVAENGFGASVDKQEYGYAYIFDESIPYIIRKLNEECDAVIVVCHAGVEMWNLPLPEWRTQYKSFIELGANAVIAHHPHVPQGWEDYKDGVIFYSLGNFAFNKGKKVQNGKSLAVILEITNGLLSYQVIPIEFRDKRIQICSESDYLKEIEYNCSILEDENIFLKEVEKMCISSYENIYRDAYLRVACRYNGGIKEKAKGIIKRFIINRGFQDIWLYHNLNIESHYYVCKRATRILMNEKEIL